MDGYTGFSLGTQYNFAVKDNKTIATESVAQNPGVVDVEVCSVTGCSYDPNGDQLFVYPPGNPKIDSITPATGAAHGGNVIVLHGSNLGCIVAVAFGKVVTLTTTNTKALLTCGSTDQVEVVAPPGVAGTTVGVRVATVESFFTEKGNASNSLAYSYTPSAPSQPVECHCHRRARPGDGEVAPADERWGEPCHRICGHRLFPGNGERSRARWGHDEEDDFHRPPGRCLLDFQREGGLEQGRRPQGLVEPGRARPR